ncbi:ATP-binding protein [Marinitoga sp. 1197]|nr:IS21-like element helper ATPase IstB [Marinitoga sp. 1197]KLO21990.1 ATP-binding protein [Marinitoga sp. 1197]
MNNYIKLQNNLTELNLINIKTNLDKYLNLINTGEKSVIDALYELSELETKAKEKRAMNACVKVANFPFLKGIEDFNFQPGINKQEILDLKSLRFVENNENILFVGTPGVGKTHLAVSIGIECAKHRYSTYFIHFQDLMSQLKKALKENRLETRLKHFSKYKVLIIDEIGYLPIDTDASNLFFQLISKRYEKHSTIITTNMPFSSWGEIFGSPVLAQAILDRLLHHSHVISIKGESYRLKEKMDFFANSVSNS